MRTSSWKAVFLISYVLTLGFTTVSSAGEFQDPAKKSKAPANEFRAPAPHPNAAGGPDAFGYRYVDSNEPGGPVFAWVDISETGTPILTDVDDDYAYPVEIGFPFTFYGQAFTQAAVGSNGHVYFQDEYLGLNNVCVPGVTDYAVWENFIAAYWTDLVVDSPGTVYAQTLGVPGSRRFVVQFDQVDFYDCGGDGPSSGAPFGPGAGLSFEVILNEADSSILIQYLDADSACEGEDNGGYAVVGIQRDPTLGLAYSCYEPVLEDGLAVLFYLPEPFIPDVTFLDDMGRSELCIQKSNGSYQWTNREGSVYTGTLVVANGGTAFWTNPEDPTYLFATYDVRRKRARAYFANSEDGNYNSLSDRNTTNNPSCGSLLGEPLEPSR